MQNSIEIHRTRRRKTQYHPIKKIFSSNQSIGVIPQRQRTHLPSRTKTTKAKVQKRTAKTKSRTENITLADFDNG